MTCLMRSLSNLDFIWSYCVRWDSYLDLIWRGKNNIFWLNARVGLTVGLCIRPSHIILNFFEARFWLWFYLKENSSKISFQGLNFIWRHTSLSLVLSVKLDFIWGENFEFAFLSESGAESHFLAFCHRIFFIWE